MTTRLLSWEVPEIFHCLSPSPICPWSRSLLCFGILGLFATSEMTLTFPVSSSKKSTNYIKRKIRHKNRQVSTKRRMIDLLVIGSNHPAVGWVNREVAVSSEDHLSQDWWCPLLKMHIQNNSSLGNPFSDLLSEESAHSTHFLLKIKPHFSVRDLQRGRDPRMALISLLSPCVDKAISFE